MVGMHLLRVKHLLQGFSMLRGALLFKLKAMLMGKVLL
jgi:hypothetical protein